MGLEKQADAMKPTPSSQLGGVRHMDTDFADNEWLAEFAGRISEPQAGGRCLRPGITSVLRRECCVRRHY